MKKIVRMVFGSHMYGLNTPESDTDYKGIYLPELNDLLLGTYAKHISFSTGDDTSKNTKDDIDDDWIALPEFIRLAVKGETVALDMLHVNPAFSVVELGEYGWIWNELVRNRSSFYSKNLNAYIGYVKRQSAKYGIKGSRIAAMREVIAFLSGTDQSITLSTVWSELPENEYASKTLTGDLNFYCVNAKQFQSTVTVAYALERITAALNAYGDRALLAEKNQGLDWKAISHAIRAGTQLRSILADGSFTYPLADRDFIMQVKRGELDYTTVVGPMLELLIDEVAELTSKSGLPDFVDATHWNDWLLHVYHLTLIDELY